MKIVSKKSMSMNMMINNIITNINYFERLNTEKSLVQNNNSAGYVSIVQLVIGLLISGAILVAGIVVIKKKVIKE